MVAKSVDFEIKDFDSIASIPENISNIVTSTLNRYRPVSLPGDFMESLFSESPVSHLPGFVSQFEMIFSEYLSSANRGEWYLKKLAIEKSFDFLEIARNSDRLEIGERATLTRLLGRVNNDESLKLLERALMDDLSSIREAALIGLSELMCYNDNAELLIQSFLKAGSEANPNVLLTAKEILGIFE